MTIYLAREASKVWRKVCAETTTELPMLREKWPLLLAGIVFQLINISLGNSYNNVLYNQYIHGLAARGVHYLHRPGPLLQDLGFMALPELGQDKNYLSECTFVFIFFSFFLVGFYYEFPLFFYDGVNQGGFIKLLAWMMAIIQSLLIIAARKHYTVDVVVAWYAVNLVVFFVDTKLPEMPDRTNGSPLIPLSNKDKDGRPKDEKDVRLKDEFHKLLNGNHGDATDRRQRVQMNGRHAEEDMSMLSDATPNGT
ncbi:hypothetical protein TRIUR3_23119 [Triticum urartu]|uniref:Sphingomyelin synthase-like domain-containing protein n=1 Tax=Triticum urartu TaxID=4572 RepID=M8A7F6_TRIUA|nr:hypothetical protein TRIUR3_23119 [Triticum urartu]